MPLENLKNSAIFKVITDAVFEEVDMVPIKMADFFFQKYLGDGVQLVLLVELWNRFAKSSCLRLIVSVMEDCIWFI